MISKSRNLIVKMLFSLILIQMMYNSNIALANPTKTQVQYEVKNTDNQTNTWYNETFSPFHYKVIKNTLVNVTIDNINNFNSNLTIEIGNLTRSNVNDSEADFNLGFGYYEMPYAFGFIANTSWSLLETTLKSYIPKTTFTDKNMGFLGGTISVISIQFNDGTAQNTTLIYNKANGLLLYAKTVIFGFLLELNIYSINNNNGFYSSSAKLDTIFYLFPTLFMLVFLGKHKRKYN